MKAYEGVDWRDRGNWGCNNWEHPSRKGTYFGSSVGPMEVLFHKETFSNSKIDEGVNSDIMKVYMDSMDEQLDKKG